MNDADEALVAKSRRGDRQAFEELIRRTGRLVFSRCYLDTGDVHRAEDLAQETFLIAWRSIGQVSDAGGFRAWLMSIARSAAIDAARHDRRKKRSAGRGDESDLRELTDASSPPDISAERQEQKQIAMDALRDLPEEYRQVLTLRYLGGADYETIEKQLALSNGSLRGLLHRGMAILREKLKEKEV